MACFCGALTAQCACPFLYLPPLGADDSCELPPTNLTRYREMISAFGAALVHRYGIEEVATWKFEVYNEAVRLAVTMA